MLLVSFRFVFAKMFSLHTLSSIHILYAFPNKSPNICGKMLGYSVIAERLLNYI